MEAQAELSANRAYATLGARCRKDPVFFVEWALGHKTWSKQREILNAIRDHEKVAVRASHGVSKTYTAAEIVAWFLNCIPHSKVITTAPTWTQVAKLLWAEVNKIYATSRIRLEGECLTLEIKTKHADHYALGFSTDKPARAEGYHAPAILFVFDEAKGIPQWMWDSARGAMTGGFCRWLAISTTDGVQVGDQFHRIFNSENDWAKIHVSAFDSPYVTGETFRSVSIPDATHPERFEVTRTDSKDVQIQIAGPAYIEDCKAEWGEDSILYRTKVLGMIEDAGADSIIKLSQIQQMFANGKDETFAAEGAEEIGVDVARGGTDDVDMWKRKGLKVIEHKIIPPKAMPEKARLVYVAEEVKRFAGYNKEIRIKVDDTGVGGGVTDILQADGYNVVPVNFGGSAGDPDRYPNAPSEMWFEVGKIIHEISCPYSSRLEVELADRRSKALDKKGRRVVESKDDYKERHGGKSPDDADGFLLAFYDPKTIEPNIRSLRS